jgi:hypothetical protein
MRDDASITSPNKTSPASFVWGFGPGYLKSLSGIDRMEISLSFWPFHKNSLDIRHKPKLKQQVAL